MAHQAPASSAPPPADGLHVPFSLLSHFVIDLGLKILVSRTQNVSPFPICLPRIDLVQNLRKIEPNNGIRADLVHRSDCFGEESKKLNQIQSRIDEPEKKETQIRSRIDQEHQEQ